MTETDKEDKSSKASQIGWQGLWKLYKRVIAFPAVTSGTERRIGYCLYIVCLLAAVALVAWMLKERQEYVDYSVEGGDFIRGVDHFIPDIVVCPARKSNSPFHFNVRYNHHLIRQLNMTAAHVNWLAQRMYDSCSVGVDCSWPLQSKCYLTPLAHICETFDGIMKTVMTPNQTSINPKIISPTQKRYLSKILKEKEATTLELLWMYIIDKQYFPLINKGSELKENVLNFVTWDEWKDPQFVIDCYLYKNEAKRDPKARKRCLKNQKILWVDNALCVVVLGEKVGKVHTPYIGFDGFVRGPIEYWLGSLATMKLDPDQFVSNTRRRGVKLKARVSGVGYYWMVHMNDTTGKRSKCIEPSHHRGIKISCPKSELHSSYWYYGLSYQERPLTRVWVYPKTVRKLKVRTSFTLYTQIQFAASLFSCFIGVSLMQIIQIALNHIKKSPKFNRREEKFSQITAFGILLAISITLAGIDLKTYFNTRYMKVFKQEEVQLPLPTVQFCSDHYVSYGFLNVSKLYEYNVSVSLYAYLRYAGLLTDPVINLIAKNRIENGSKMMDILHNWMIKGYPRQIDQTLNCTADSRQCETAAEPFSGIIKYERRMFSNCFDYEDPSCFDRSTVNVTKYFELARQLRTEAKEFSNKLGYKKEARIVDLVRPFYLDLDKLVSSCGIGGKDIPNCGRFAKYSFEKRRHTTCLVVQIEKNELPKSLQSYVGNPGMEGALEVKLSVEEYKKHSDLNSYYGPGTQTARKKFRNHILCSRMRWVRWPFVKLGCNAGRSWKVKITHPAWYLKFMQHLHDARGLAYPESHTFEIEIHRNQKLATAPGVNCKSKRQQNFCPYPREHMGLLFKAVQMHIWCGCSYCFYDKVESSEGFYSQMGKILGRKVNCCKVSDLTKCYGRFLTKLKVNVSATTPVYVMDKNLRIVNSFNLEMVSFENPAEWEKASPELMKKHIIDYKKFPPLASKRLIERVRECFKLPCDEYKIESSSYQNEKTNGKTVDFTVLYVSKEAIGTKQIDRLDPAQFIGIIMCTYSFTFGIGIVGLCELLIIFLKKLRYGRYEVSSEEIIQDHLIRSAGIWGNSENKVGPDENNPEMTNHQDGQPSNAAQNELDNSSKKAKNSKDLHMVLEDIENQQGVEQKEQEVEVFKKKISVESTLSTDDLIVGQAPNSSPPEGSVNGTLMVIALLINTLIMVALLFYFFQSAEMLEYSADIAISPQVYPPSIVVCSSGIRMVELSSFIKNSSCSTRNQEFQSCDKTFTVSFKPSDGLSCFMMDNSRRQNSLNTKTSDLIFRANKHSPFVMLGAYSLNKTKLTNIKPYFEWKKQNMLFEYSTDLKYLSNNCVLEPVPNKKCSVCSENFSLESTHEKGIEMCCTNSNQLEPLQYDGKSCTSLQYSISLSIKKLHSKSHFKTATFRPQQDTVVVFSVQHKHDFASLFSIVGGFFGSFIEVTILSFACLAFMGLRGITGLKKKLP